MYTKVWVLENLILYLLKNVMQVAILLLVNFHYCLKYRMTSTSGSKLYIFHGGEFQRAFKLIYSECECSEVKVDSE